MFFPPINWINAALVVTGALLNNETLSSKLKSILKIYIQRFIREQQSKSFKPIPNGVYHYVTYANDYCFAGTLYTSP